MEKIIEAVNNSSETTIEWNGTKIKGRTIEGLYIECKIGFNGELMTAYPKL